jgi:putative FmdB family regulatory protein
MPTYTYSCIHCGKTERTCPKEDRNRQYCECGSRLDRLLSTPSVQFKGEGFTKAIKDK